MSHFSTALRAALEECGISQSVLCDRTGIGQSPMSRYVNGSTSVGREVAAKIIKALPEPHNGRVLAAYLRDEIPDEMEALVTIASNEGSRVPEEVDALPPGMDRELRKLIIWFADRSIVHPEIRNMLVSFRAAVDAE